MEEWEKDGMEGAEGGQEDVYRGRENGGDGQSIAFRSQCYLMKIK